MEFYDCILLGSVVLVVAMICFTVALINKSNKVKMAEQTNRQISRKILADWRVYALEETGNCFCGAEIILNSENDEFGIGRQEGNTLRLIRPEIGRQHAKVTRKGIVYTYTDLGSYAGSICDHVKIKEKRLQHLMVVWVYNVALVFANCDVPHEILVQAVKKSPR